MSNKTNILPFDGLPAADPEMTRPDLLSREMISVVIPVYNEAANLPDLWARVAAVMQPMGRRWEVVFIDDGSTDDSLKMLRGFALEAPGQVRVVELSRNFGQHSAILAGFKQSRGDIVVTLDADLQNPPEEIPRLIEAIDAGNDVVGGWREERQDQPDGGRGQRAGGRHRALIRNALPTPGRQRNAAISASAVASSTADSVAA